MKLKFNRNNTGCLFLSLLVSALLALLVLPPIAYLVIAVSFLGAPPREATTPVRTPVRVAQIRPSILEHNRAIEQGPALAQSSGAEVAALATSDTAISGDTATTQSASTADAALAYDPAEIEAGEMTFSTICSACHGPDAQGLPGLGKDLVHSEFVGSLDDANLLAFIKMGRPVWDAANTTGMDMPPRGGNPALTDEDLECVIAYLRNLRLESGAAP